MEPSVTAAQQAAIASLRGRYERGEISYDALREGLDRIVAAGSAEECDTILRELPPRPRLLLPRSTRLLPRYPHPARKPSSR